MAAKIVFVKSFKDSNGGLCNLGHMNGRLFEYVLDQPQGGAKLPLSGFPRVKTV